MIGPGKYDDVCTKAFSEAMGDDPSGGGVMLIVIGGKLGPGFSCQADLATSKALPDILEDIARQIRKDTAELKP